MKLKYNLILIPILIVAALAVNLMMKKDAADQAAMRVADRALVDIGKIDVIELSNSHGSLRIERTSRVTEGPGKSDEWNITEPFKAGCDPQNLATLLDNIKKAEIERDIKGIDATQKQEYGLENPEITLRIATGGAILMDLAIGKTNPSGSAQYAQFKSDESNCFLIPIYNTNPFKFEPNSFRDKRALPFDTADIVSIQISSAVADIHIAKEETGWMLTEPKQFSASPTRVDLFFQHILRLAAEDFVEPNSNSPELDINLVNVFLGKTDGTKLELSLHGEDIKRGYFATSTYQPTPFIAGAYIYDLLALDPDVFFHIALVEIPKDKIKRVIVREPKAENLEIEKIGKKMTDWKINRPAGQTASDPKDFGRLIDSIFALEPVDNIDPPETEGQYGIYPVYNMKLEIIPADGTSYPEASIYIGNPDEDGNFYSTTDGLSYFTLDGKLVESFVGMVNKLRGE